MSTYEDKENLDNQLVYDKDTFGKKPLDPKYSRMNFSHSEEKIDNDEPLRDSSIQTASELISKPNSQKHFNSVSQKHSNSVAEHSWYE